MARAPYIPLVYRLFFLYVEPVSALLGAYFAAVQPADYLAYLAPAPTSLATASTSPPTPTLVSLLQLANLYLLFALNEHLVLSSTSDRRVWRRLLLGLLIADFGHLATMVPLAHEKGFLAVFVDFPRWSAMEWGSVGFVYAGASMRMSFLAGVGLPSGDTGQGRDAASKAE
ncbi:uncharacterized protein B0H18DRAFT_877524 [Fomitopsis serialis]|uniref:uncharacterized protein n=1 Tax=Fomitopsis serialis TaxID=139415 RepID=UPI002007AE75|nr:uncharacterized protein B0H18DRAFT_877524 [Neoantrodia serialis]KAH9924899.1 hypothetical protein B0H18DRAFT_877524 [Neoantrodia serialis]